MYQNFYITFLAKSAKTTQPGRRMDDVRFYVLFNSISVISGRWADNNERFCAMESRLRLRRFRIQHGSNPRPLVQLASALPTELPELLTEPGKNVVA